MICAGAEKNIRFSVRIKKQGKLQCCGFPCFLLWGGPAQNDRHKTPGCGSRVTAIAALQRGSSGFCGIFLVKRRMPLGFKSNFVTFEKIEWNYRIIIDFTNIQDDWQDEISFLMVEMHK